MYRQEAREEQGVVLGQWAAAALAEYSAV